MIHDDSVPNQSADSDANTMTKITEVEIYGEPCEVEYVTSPTTFVNCMKSVVVETTEMKQSEVEVMSVSTVFELGTEILQSFDETEWK